MAVRECDWCRKEYHICDEDADTFLEHFCSEECENLIEDAIDEYYELNPPMMSFGLPHEI